MFSDSVLCTDEALTGNYNSDTAERQLDVPTKSNLKDNRSPQNIWAGHISNLND